jgi:hypothetical protein
MSEPTEMLAGAVTKLRHAIHPLAFDQFAWDGQTRRGDPIYRRMRIAYTATTPTAGAPMQASKAPARIDVMNWFCDIDTTVARWIRAGTDTPRKLLLLHDFPYTPDHLKTVKAITSRCEHWVESAKELLGDNPPIVPLRKPCPLCNELWHHTGAEQTRTFALRASEHGAQCHACKAKWVTDQEISVLIKMLG